MKILNMERLKRKLARIPDNVKRRAQADLMLAGREINMLQRSLAPEEDGVLRGTIRTEPLTDGTVGVEIKAGGPATTKTVKSGKGAVAYTVDYAVEQEYGNKNMPPNAYFWPGYKARRRKAMGQVRRGVRRALKEAASGD